MVNPAVFAVKWDISITHDSLLIEFYVSFVILLSRTEQQDSF